MKNLSNFFRNNAYIFVIFALLNLIANGWRSISWMPWLLMAFGLSVDTSERSKWHSPTYVVTVLLAAALLLYRAIYHSK